MFVNPDKEGYLYDYDQVKNLEGDKKEVKESNVGKTQDFGTELRDAIKRASLKRMSDINTSDSDVNGAKTDDKTNESSDFASSTAINKTDGETTGPEAHSSPKPTKKKRKSSKERKSPSSRRKHKKDGEGSPKSKHHAPKKETSIDDIEDAPPEVFAPIFSDEDNDDTSSHYSHMYQPGYQGQQPPAPPYNQYPGYGNAPYPYQPGMPGMYPQGYPPGAPFQQAGQAQWFMEQQPNGQQKMAFAMQTHSQSDDSLGGGHHGPPNYTSTPYRPSGGKSLVPAGTVLDDPQIPQPGTSLMRYDEDPLSGIKTSQVVWTDAKKDPTDPPPDSATQVTRKTITRITTRATKEDLPEQSGPSKI